MPGWGPALTASALSLVGNFVIIAFFFGGLAQRVKNVEEDCKDSKGTQREQWQSINRIDRDLGRVKGKLQMNGGYRED
jgi:hypothetical protein